MTQDINAENNATVNTFEEAISPTQRLKNLIEVAKLHEEIREKKREMIVTEVANMILDEVEAWFKDHELQCCTELKVEIQVPTELAAEYIVVNCSDTELTTANAKQLLADRASQHISAGHLEHLSEKLKTQLSNDNLFANMKEDGVWYIHFICPF